MATPDDYQDLAGEIRAVAALLPDLLRGLPDETIVKWHVNTLQALADRAIWWAREEDNEKTAALVAAVIERAKMN